MPALDTSTAIGTPTHVDIKLTDHHTRDRQLLLILSRHTGLDDRSGAGRTVRRQRRLMAFIDLSGHATTGLKAIRVARLAARPFRMRVQRFRKGRRLSEPGATRLVQLALEVLHALAETFRFALQRISLASQRIPFSFGSLRSLAEPFSVRQLAIGVSGTSRFRHAPVMPEFPRRYKTR